MFQTGWRKSREANVSVESLQREERSEEGREGEALGVRMGVRLCILAPGGRSRGLWNSRYGQLFEELCCR